MKRKKYVKGIGGWLALYIVFLAIGFFGELSDALYFLAQTGGEINIISGTYLLLSFILLGLMFNSFTAILAERKKAIKRNKHMLRYWLIVNIVLLIFAILAVSAGLVDGSIALPLGSLIFAAVVVAWINYWNKSERVKNTMVK